MTKMVNAGVMAIIFNAAEDRILLHKRTDNDLWSLPGGSLDFGESLFDAVKREVLEETGFIVEPTRFVGIYSDPRKFIFNYPDGNRVHSVVTVFCCHINGGELMRVNAESKDVKWFDVSDIPDELWDMQRIVISDAMTNTYPFVR